MHEDIEFKDIKQAIDLASPEAIDLVDVVQDDAFIENLQKAGVSKSDADQIAEEVKLVALGLTKHSYLVDNILTRTDGDESTIQAIVLSIEERLLNPLNQILVAYPINNETIPTNTVSQGRDVGLMSVLKDNDMTGDLSRDSILDQIESPDETIKKPNFAFPKSKPSVVDVLKKAADVPLPPVSAADELGIKVVDPFKALKIADVIGAKDAHLEELPKIIDPLKQTPLAPITKSNTVDTIQGNLEKKLSAVVGTETKETFKVASDPYKEPIS